MTHTLHRMGAPEDLGKDFVVMSMAARTVNAAGSGPRMRQIFEIIERHNPVNFGDAKAGNRFVASRDAIHDNLKDGSYVHFVFTDQATVEKVLEALREADLGISVVVSGLIDTTDEMCRQAGLKMHTVEFSGGIHGKTGLLAERPILEITTMCGHGLVAANLVREMVEQVKKGKKTLGEAAAELARPCQCGIFNPARGERLLAKFL